MSVQTEHLTDGGFRPTALIALRIFRQIQFPSEAVTH